MVTKRTAKILALRYKMMAGILIVLATGLVLLPKYQKIEGINAEQLLSNTISLERYVTTDQIAHKIVNQDPSFFLIDLREENSYNRYSLPNAINIPLKKILDKDFEAYLNQNQFDVVFFSDDNFYSDQAWALCTRLKYKNLYVLKGGANKWFTTIINPQQPNENEDLEAFDLYSTRKATSMFFGVAYPDQVAEEDLSTNNSVPRKVIVLKKKKKKAPEGGC